jgi:hypothetical protein
MKKLYLGIVLASVIQCFAHDIMIDPEWFAPLKTIDNFVSLILVRNYVRALNHWNRICNKIENSELTKQEKKSMERLAQRVNDYLKMFKDELEQDEQAVKVKEYFEVLEKHVASGPDKHMLEREFLKNLKNVLKYHQKKRAKRFMHNSSNHLREFARDCKEDPKKFHYERVKISETEKS